MAIYLAAAVFLVLQGIFFCSCSQTPDDNHHEEIFGSDANYQLQWTVDYLRKSVIFSLAVKCQGIFGLGLSRNGLISSGSHFAIINPSPLKFFDMIGNKDGTLVLNQHPEWKLISSNRTGNWTYVTFSRGFATHDKQTIPINNDLIHLIWTFGDSKQITRPLQNFGIFKVYLLDPDHTTIAANNAFIQVSPAELFGLKYWSATAKQTLPASLESNVCSFITGSITTGSLDGWLVGVGKYFAYESRNDLVRRITLSRCTTPEGFNSSSEFFEQFTNSSGTKCSEATIPRHICTEVIFVLGTEGKPYYFPDGLGFKLTHDDYFLLDVHYINPDVINNLEIEAGLSIVYSPVSKEKEPGIMKIGINSNDNGKLKIPLSRNLNPIVKVNGRCSTTASKNATVGATESNENGYTIYAVLMILGKFGRSMKIRHLRNNKEVSLILSDENYDYSFQQIRSLKDKVTILSKDEIAIECMYDTTSAFQLPISKPMKEIEEECLVYLFTDTPLVDASCERYPSPNELHSVPTLSTKLTSTSSAANIHSSLSNVAVSGDYDRSLHYIKPLRPLRIIPPPATMLKPLIPLEYEAARPFPPPVLLRPRPHPHIFNPIIIPPPPPQQHQYGYQNYMRKRKNSY